MNWTLDLNHDSNYFVFVISIGVVYVTIITIVYLNQNLDVSKVINCKVVIDNKLAEQSYHKMKKYYC